MRRSRVDVMNAFIASYPIRDFTTWAINQSERWKSNKYVIIIFSYLLEDTEQLKIMEIAGVKPTASRHVVTYGMAALAYGSYEYS